MSDFNFEDFEEETTATSSDFDFNQFEEEVKDPTTRETLTAVAEGAAEGATLGFGEEVSAALSALLPPTATDEAAGRGDYLGGMGERYDQALELRRKQQAEAKEAAPTAYTAAEIAGTLPSAIATGGATAAATKGAGLAAKIGAGAAEGAGFGAAVGAGTAEGGAQERLKSAGEGAVLGAALGGALPAAGAAIGGTVKGIQKITKGFDAIAEDNPILGLIKAGLKGEDVSTATAAQRTISEPAEALARETADVVDDLSKAVAKPAEETVEATYRQTLEEAGQELGLEGQKLTGFLDDILKKRATEIKALEEGATTEIPVKQILRETRNKIDDLVEQGDIGEDVAKRVLNKLDKKIKVDVPEGTLAQEATAPQAKRIQRTLSSEAQRAGKEFEGELKTELNSAYNAVKNSLEEALGSDYQVAKTSWRQAKEVLERAGVNDLPSEIDEVVQTPKSLERIFTKMADYSESASPSDVNKVNLIFEGLDKIDPNVSANFRKGLQEASENLRQLQKGKTANPLEKARKLGLEKEAETLEDVSSLQERIGGRADPSKKVAYANDVRQPGVQQKTRQFLSKLGEDFESNLEIDEALSTLEKQGKQAGGEIGNRIADNIKKIKTDGNRLAELARLASPITRTDAITGEAALSTRGVILGSLAKIGSQVANFTGLQGRKIGIDKVAKALRDNSQLFGKFQDTLLEVANTSVPAFVATTMALSDDPEFDEIAQANNLYVESGEEVSEEFGQLKNELRTEPETFGRYAAPLQRAAERGDAALKAAYYTLSQKPDFRKATGITGGAQGE